MSLCPSRPRSLGRTETTGASDRLGNTYELAVNNLLTSRKSKEVAVPDQEFILPAETVLSTVLVYHRTFETLGATDLFPTATPNELKLEVGSDGTFITFG